MHRFRIGFRSLALAAALILPAALGLGHGASAQQATPPAAPPAPAGQYGAVLFGSGSPDEGAQLFGRECAFCHVGTRNTGSMMLGRRLGADKAELHKRSDLQADYVKAVVRNGLVNMPAFSKVELTDAELDRIAGWLARKGKR